jgi:O-antigen/teichoic acid export membrane protein
VISRALGALLAQGAQAGVSFVLQVLVARLLGIEELGRFAILYGVVVIATGIVSGVVGDSLVVLDRAEPAVRWALQVTTLALSATAGVAGALVFLSVGLITPLEALLFAAATTAFTCEEVLRRLLMAHFGFLRVVVADLGGFAFGLALILGVTFAAAPSLALVLGGITVGQLVALVLAALLLPRAERQLASPQRGGLRAVVAYGTWRGLQQLLRPGLLTAMRLLVGVAAGLAAVGLLEAARVYVAPALLAVSGLTSFLFVRYAKDRDHPLAAVLHRADLTVGALVAGTVVLGAVGLALLPWLGPLLFGVHPDAAVVVGWLAFTVAVAATTPYGSLAAVHGGQRRVFSIRLGDSLLSLAGVAVLLLAGASPGWAPYVLAGGALLGGLAIRFLVLVPRARRSRGDGLPDGAGA